MSTHYYFRLVDRTGKTMDHEYICYDAAKHAALDYLQRLNADGSPGDGYIGASSVSVVTKDVQDTNVDTIWEGEK